MEIRVDGLNICGRIATTVAAATLLGGVADAGRFGAQASQNVLDLQKRVAGVLPISVNVPHAGNSYRFVRPLVVNEETRVTFNYRIGKL